MKHEALRHRHGATGHNYRLQDNHGLGLDWISFHCGPSGRLKSTGHLDVAQFIDLIELWILDWIILDYQTVVLGAFSNSNIQILRFYGILRSCGPYPYPKPYPTLPCFVHTLLLSVFQKELGRTQEPSWRTTLSLEEDRNWQKRCVTSLRRVAVAVACSQFWVLRDFVRQL